MMKHTLQMDRLIEMDRKFFEGVQWWDVPLTRKDVGQKLAEIAKTVESFCKRLGDPDDPVYINLNGIFVECARNTKSMLLGGLMAPCHNVKLFAELPLDLVSDNDFYEALIRSAYQVRWSFRVLHAWRRFPVELRDLPIDVIRIVRQYEIHVSKNKGL